MHRLLFPRFLAASLLAAAASGCSLNSLAVRTTSAALDRGRGALYSESDPDFAREALPGNLKMLETLLESAPSDPRLLGLLAEGFTGYSFLFLEDEAPERAVRFYQRAARYGLRLLALNRKLSGLESLDAAAMAAVLPAAARADVPGLFWTATAWADEANLAKNDSAALARIPKAARMMQRVLELDPDYAFHGAETFFAVYDCSLPKVAGGDPERGRRRFEAVFAGTRRAYLQAQYLCMKYCAVALLDDEDFRKLAREIAAAPADGPAMRLANEVAKRKSRSLMERIDDLF